MCISKRIMWIISKSHDENFIYLYLYRKSSFSSLKTNYCLCLRFCVCDEKCNGHYQLGSEFSNDFMPSQF